MEPKSFVFFDLDGTLLNNESKIEPEVVKALEEMQLNGHIPFIATGRSPLEINFVLDSTSIDSFIALNGQYIVYQGKEIHRSSISIDTLIRLKQATEERNFALSFYTSNKIRTTRQTKALKDAYEFIRAPIPSIDHLVHLNEEILMALVLSADEKEDGYFRKQFPELSFYRNTPYSMDTIPRGNSKATGIKELMSKLTFEHLPTYAFGDGPNDIEMIDHVNYGVAMGNGLDILKDRATYITSSNTQGGIIEGLTYFGLI
ncbi:Cof-type HAD-IIB family hydrolase [Carnobacterium sp.]|uniref:Cof-type HAD-IIB family hydrolase n=1 Tax=Carnobacterium sp. TaxID=48221 RepID=UPI003C708D77